MAYGDGFDGVLNFAMWLGSTCGARQGDQPALISLTVNTVSTFTYSQLLEKTATIAGGLVELGVTKGDGHYLYADGAETAAAMLACARIGAIHSVVFAASPKELAELTMPAKVVASLVSKLIR